MRLASASHDSSPRFRGLMLRAQVAAAVSDAAAGVEEKVGPACSCRRIHGLQSPDWPWVTCHPRTASTLGSFKA